MTSVTARQLLRGPKDSAAAIFGPTWPIGAVDREAFRRGETRRLDHLWSPRGCHRSRSFVTAGSRANRERDRGALGARPLIRARALHGAARVPEWAGRSVALPPQAAAHSVFVSADGEAGEDTLQTQGATWSHARRRTVLVRRVLLALSPLRRGGPARALLSLPPPPTRPAGRAHRLGVLETPEVDPRRWSKLSPPGVAPDLPPALRRDPQAEPRSSHLCTPYVLICDWRGAKPSLKFLRGGSVEAPELFVCLVGQGADPARPLAWCEQQQVVCVCV